MKGRPMIEQFSHKYENFFDEPRYQVRWERLKRLYLKDYPSFRVLFLIETAGLLDKWSEPTATELNALLRHKIDGGELAIRIGSIMDLFKPVWPLEVAKYEYQIHRATWDSTFRRRYFITSIRSYATALVQTWWAFETMMNHFASIIAKERHGTLDPASLALLEEKRPTINKRGVPSLESYYQPLMPRMQFIYRLLTGEVLDRGSTEWQHIVELKDTRDAYIHRVGKQSGKAKPFREDDVIVNGFSAVRSIIGQVLTKTTEFESRFVYKYLAFWSCGSESPFIWDGSQGDSIYLGLGSIKEESIVGLFAPMPGSFKAEMEAPPSTAGTTPTSSTPSTGRKRKSRKRSH